MNDEIARLREQAEVIYLDAVAEIERLRNTNARIERKLDEIAAELKTMHGRIRNLGI